jgi:hypothetical protein
MGLGSVDDVGLAEARRRRDEAARVHERGLDPIEHRLAEKARAKIVSAKAMTFDECRDAYITSHRAGWRNAKHAAQWTSTLARYVYPVFGKVPVQASRARDLLAGRIDDRRHSQAGWADHAGQAAAERSPQKRALAYRGM